MNCVTYSRTDVYTKMSPTALTSKFRPTLLFLHSILLTSGPLLYLGAHKTKLLVLELAEAWKLQSFRTKARGSKYVLTIRAIKKGSKEDFFSVESINFWFELFFR